jgi:hypothetical protein
MTQIERYLTLITKPESESFLKFLSTPRNESIRVGFGSGFVTSISIQQEIDSMSIRFDSISSFIDFDSKAK